MAFKSPLRDGLTLINFRRFFMDYKNNEVVRNSITNTLIYFVVTNFVALPIVLVSSYFLFKKVFGYKVYRVVFYLPSIISSAVIAMLFKYLVAGDGPIVSLLVKLGADFPQQVFNNGLLGYEKTAYSTIMFYCVWLGFGTNLILFTGALSRIPKEIFESAKIDGAGLFREFLQIACPLIWPTISTILILNIAGTFTFFGPIMLLTYGNYDTMTVGWYIYSHILDANSSYSYNYPAAVGLLFTAVILPIVLLVKYLLEKISPEVEY